MKRKKKKKEKIKIKKNKKKRRRKNHWAWPSTCLAFSFFIVVVVVVSFLPSACPWRFLIIQNLSISSGFRPGTLPAIKSHLKNCIKYLGSIFFIFLKYLIKRHLITLIFLNLSAYLFIVFEKYFLF